MTEVTELPEERDWTDRFGAVASSLCAIHCALCAIGGIFATIGLESLEENHSLEWWLTLVAVAFGLAALYFGWRHHRSRNVLILIVAGILALGVSRGLEMSSGHHDGDKQAEGKKHEGEEHHNEEGAHAEKSAEGDHEGHDDHGHEHGGILHDVGAGTGVLGGILLFLGHLANLRATRRWREECCA